MKPALSPTTTGCLPSRRARSTTASTTSGSVTTVRTISTNFWTGAGLKKCMPTTRLGSCVATEISVTDRLEVFVASTVSGEQIESSLPKISRLRSSFSGTASITRWAAARSSGAEVNRIRPSNACWSASLSFPRATAREVERSTCPRPVASRLSSASTAITSRPLRARTSAMPAPIVPSPTTPTTSIGRLLPRVIAASSSTSVSVLAVSQSALTGRSRPTEGSEHEGPDQKDRSGDDPARRGGHRMGVGGQADVHLDADRPHPHRLERLPRVRDLAS